MVALSISTSSQSPFLGSNESARGGLGREERGGGKGPALALALVLLLAPALVSGSADDGEILPRPCWM